MTTNNIINAPIPFSLANGGTGANLTASNGGIFYSTGSAGAILSGTATAGQILLSGASGAPTWSTTTYPSIGNASELLYASSANVVTGLAQLDGGGILCTNSSGVPGWVFDQSNGTILIGSTGSSPVVSTLTAGTNVTITNGTAAITINSSSGGSPEWVLLSSQTASNSASLNFVSKLGSSYNAYVFTFSQILPASNEVILQMNLGTGSTPTWVTTGYQGLNNIVVASQQFAITSTTAFKMSSDTSYSTTYQLSSTNGNLCGVVFLIGTNGSSATASVNGTCSYLDGSGAPITLQVGGTIGAATYTSVKFSMSSGNITSGIIEMYGIVK